jgi:hypothetical protein
MSLEAIVVLSLGLAAQAAVLLDRIAVVVADRVLKDSDIDRDLRITAFLNGTPVPTGTAARKQAASRLIDQALIRREIEVGQYPEASPGEVRGMLAQVRKQRFPTDAAFTGAIAKAGLTEAQLRDQLAWQITVLHFIEQRFRPAVMVRDEDVQKYFAEHAAELRRAAGAGPVTLDTERGHIEERLAEEQVNKDFFAWLDDERKAAKVKYLEPELQ